MRISGLAVISPVHMPRADLAAIEALLRLPVDAERRHNFELHGIAVEAHAFGFFSCTTAVLEDGRAPEVSPTLWRLLEDAERAGCDWILVDRDEPACTELDRFDQDEPRGEAAAQPVG